MVEARGLCKRFGRLEVLRGIDLTIARNQVTAIVGPNAAGKTTLIKTILGLVRADEGTIVVDGVRIGADDTYRSRIGYMPQIARFPENLTTLDLFEMLKDLRGEKVRLDENLIHAFNLTADLKKPLRTLSGGTRQKVNAVMAFLFSPDILILDEPTAGLDPVASGVLKRKIAAEREAGKTFIVTSHIMSELEELADNVVLLQDGRVEFSGPLQEIKNLTKQTNLERAIAAMMVRGRAA